MRAATDIAKQGFPVYLLEKKPYLGGHVVQHGILFPNGGDPLEVYDNYVKNLKDLNLEIFTDSELVSVDGFIGNFNVTIKRYPDFVNNLCNLCGECEKVCPTEVEDDFNLGLNKRKAIYIPFKKVFPSKYIIDREACTKCGKCLEACKRNAINLKSTEKLMNLTLGTIIVSTGFDIYEPIGEFGYGKSPNIITLLQMERLLSKSGPTKGEIVRPTDKKRPKRIVFIGCVGSREPSRVNTPRHYCSRTCCSSIMMNSKHVKEMAPEIDIVVLYRDIRTHGRRHENLYSEARKKGVKFLKFSIENKPKVLLNSGEETFLVEIFDVSLQTNFLIPCDLIILASAMIPSAESDELASKLRITRSMDGFLQELHPKLAPLETINKGIYLSGAIQAPKDVIDSISQASGAAAKALIPMKQGKISIESAIAHIDGNLCSGCGICEESCAFNAIKMEDFHSVKVARVIEAACMGCGACGASCPSGAIKMLHFTDKQIYSTLEALLKS